MASSRGRRSVQSRGAHLVAAGAFALLAACGDSPNPPAPNPGSGGGDTITGRERIGWSQQASDGAHLSTFDFAIYVDGNRQVLSNETCGPAAGGGFDCSAPLPPLTPGQHTIELAAFTMTGDAVVESNRSAPLRVTVAGASGALAASVPRQSAIRTSDGHDLLATVIAEGFDDPTDLAVDPEGRIFVSERSGAVRIVGRDGVSPIPALELDEAAVTRESGLTGIALHPDFERNGHVYLAYAADGREGPVYRVARFRERNGILAQGAIVARGRTSAARHALVRFGADDRLYAAFAAGSDPRDAQDPGAAAGKILRLNDDGTTPRDNPDASPVYTWGHRDPRALAWHSPSGLLWVVERDPDAGDELNAIRPGADYGWPLARGADGAPQRVPAALVLPPGADVAGASFVPGGNSSPLAGELLVASAGAEDLLRIHVGAGARPGLVEGLLQGRYGRLGAIHVSRDGTILIATANRDTWGPGRDVLIAVRAAR